MTARELNRATLARQLLLAREDCPVVDALEHLVGLQAQVPGDPYVALWSRLDGFRPETLSELVLQRRVVRVTVMRSTIHLVTADDCLLLRPLMQPVIDAELARHGEHAPALVGVDLAPVLSFARQLFRERPRTGPELRAAFAERFPAHDAAALAFACRCKLALVQVPPRGVWGRTSRVTNVTAEEWLGRPLAPRPSLDDVVLRYLGAFGPASVADVMTWCRLTGMREVLERLRSRLRAFRDERGRELFDLADAPRPDPDTPAPTRFLPEYDNALLSHDDRTRVVPEGRRAALGRAGGVGFGSVLHDGLVCGVWRIERDRAGGGATLAATLVEPLAKRATAAIAAEGRRMLRFAAADAETRDVRVTVAGHQVQGSG
jgi:DNA glycosylase AlkZ-like